MSVQIDINSIGDLIALAGTEADKRAWARIKAERDDLHRRLIHTRQSLAVAVNEALAAEVAR